MQVFANARQIGFDLDPLLFQFYPLDRFRTTAEAVGIDDPAADD